MGCNVTRVGHVVSTYESLGKYDYAEGSTNVKSVSGGNVVFESTTLSSLQAIAKFIFKNKFIAFFHGALQIFFYICTRNMK